MKQKLTLVAMLVLAAILIASPVLAAGSSHPLVEKQDPKKWKKPTIISMTGNFTALNPDGTYDFWVQMTNKAFLKYRKTTVQVRIKEGTVCILWLRAQKSKRIDCSKLVDESLATGSMVSINAKVKDNEEFWARRVQASQPRLP